MASKEYTSVPIDDSKPNVPAPAPVPVPVPPPDSLPGAPRKPERRLHPVIPIAFWIGSSMTVIIYNACVPTSPSPARRLTLLRARVRQLHPQE